MSDRRRRSLESWLDVTGDELAQRAVQLFERESGRAYPAPLVLCGLGRLGRIALTGLRRAGVEPVALADNSRSLQGTRVEGCDVLSVDDAVKKFGHEAVFVTTVYTARPLRDQLKALGARVASSRAVFFQHADVFLPHGSMQWPPTILAGRDDAIAGLSIWADDASRDEYLAQLGWQLLVLTEMPAWVPPQETYFPTGLIYLGDTESFVDCGAFDGDTLRAIIDLTGGRFNRIVAMEPDPTNFANLSRFVGTLPTEMQGRITLHNVATHSHRATLRFESGDGAGSNLSDGGDLEVQAASLDELLANESPSFVKMDIEGAEPLALAGARATLARHAPTLAICLYHQREHLWEIPRIILDANPRYHLSLRRHSDESWETMCYAVAS